MTCLDPVHHGALRGAVVESDAVDLHAIRVGANEDPSAIRQVGAEQELCGIVQAARIHGVLRKTDDRGTGQFITDGNDLVRDRVGSLEESAAAGNVFSRQVEQRAKQEDAASVIISAKIEAEIAVLSAHEREDYLTAIGLKEAGLDRLIAAGYALLDLVTFFTAGPKESRAWTVTRGTKAPQAAGAIHSDFERGFIRAETISYDDYVACGGEAGARDAGKMRLEGKDYIVQDGDVMHFRFST